MKEKIPMMSLIHPVSLVNLRYLQFPYYGGFAVSAQTIASP